MARGRGDRRVRLTAMMAVTAMAIGTGPAWAGDPDASFEAGTATVTFGFETEFAQTFTALMPGNLDEVQLNLNRRNWVGQYSIEIQGVGADGMPDGVVLATSTVLEALPDSTSWVSFPFDSPAAVQAGTQYAVVMPVNDGPDFRYASATPSLYEQGAMYAVFSGAWSSGFADKWDIEFRTFVEPTPPASEEPEVSFDSLVEQVQSLELSQGNEHSLVAKVEGAATAADNGKTDAACGKVGAFANQVNALSGKKIDPADAESLIANASTLSDELGC